MDTQKLIEKLSKLAQLDVDAINAYEIAIEKIDIQEIKKNLTQFKGDHKQHVKDLNDAIAELGGEKVKNEIDLKGALIGGMTALRSAFGNEGALKAMRSNEEVTNKTYDDALAEKGMPVHIRELVSKNRDDERKHLAYIEQRLKEFN